MHFKGTMGLLGAFALVLSLVPAASAGIPIPGATVVSVVYDGAQTTTEVGDRTVSDAVALEMDVQVKADAFAASVGNLLMDEDGPALNDGEIDTASLVAIAGIASDAAFDLVLGESQVFQGFATDSAIALGGASEGATEGSLDTANRGIDSAVDVGFSTQGAVDNSLVSLGASTQSAARSIGGVQSVAVQGGVETYNAHAAPAACAFASIVSDFSGAVDGGSSCGVLLL